MDQTELYDPNKSENITLKKEDVETLDRLSIPSERVSLKAVFRDKNILKNE